MRCLFEVLSIFNWVTPTIELAHQIKNTPKVVSGRGDEFNLFISSKDYPKALNELRRVGVNPKRKPVGFGIMGEYMVVIPYDKLTTVASALNMAGIEWRYR